MTDNLFADLIPDTQEEDDSLFSDLIPKEPAGTPSGPSSVEPRKPFAPRPLNDPDHMPRALITDLPEEQEPEDFDWETAERNRPARKMHVRQPISDMAKRAGRGFTEVGASLPEAAAIAGAGNPNAAALFASEEIQKAKSQIAEAEARLRDNPDMDAETRARIEEVIAGERKKIASHESLVDIADGPLKPAAKDRPLYKRGEHLRKASLELFGTPDPQFDERFLSKLSEGAGNMAGFVGVTLATGLVGGAVAGSGLNTSAMYRDALANGATEEEAKFAAYIGSAIGATEVIPIGRAFDLLPSSMRNKAATALGRRLTNAFASAGEEGVQEAAAEFLNNIVAQKIYDPERGWTEGVSESAIIGAILGLGMGAVAPTPKSQNPGADISPVSPVAPITPKPLNLKDGDAESPLANELLSEGNDILDAIDRGESIPDGATPMDVLYDAPEPDAAPVAPTAAPIPDVGDSPTIPAQPEIGETTPDVEVMEDEAGRPVRVDRTTGKVTYLDAPEPDTAPTAPQQAPEPAVDDTAAQQPAQPAQEAAPEKPGDITPVAPSTPHTAPVAPEMGDTTPGAQTAPETAQIEQETDGQATEQPDPQTESPVAGEVDQDQSGSEGWVIRNKETGEAVLETKDRKKVEALNTEKYEAVPALQHLQELNDPATKASQHMRRDEPKAGVEPRKPIKRTPIKSDVAVTPAGRNVNVEYAITDIGSLTTSNTASGSVNPAYPKSLQPRDRTRGTSQEQVRKIANNINPRLLAENPSTADGAPIVSAEGVVESGNGRTLAIQRAYAEGNAEGYRAYLADQGYDIEGFENPVLVRVRQGEMSDQDRQAYTRESNDRTTLSMSSTERAMADAEAMPEAILPLYRGGDVDAAQNRDFVRKFIGSVVSDADQAAMIDSNGAMSQDAVRRVQGALLAKAYGDADLVAALTESSDTNIKAIGGALLDVAPQWAQMRQEAANGTIASEMDQTAALMEAVRIVDRARRAKRNVAEFVGQGDLLAGDTISPLGKDFLALFFRDVQSWTRPVSRDRMAGALQFYVDEAQKSAPGADMFGAAADPDAVLKAAKAKQYGEETEAGNLFDAARTDAGDGQRVQAAGRDRGQSRVSEATETARAQDEDAGEQGEVSQEDTGASLKAARAEFNRLDSVNEIGNVDAYFAASNRLSDARDAHADALAERGGRIELKNEKANLGAVITPRMDGKPGARISYFDSKGFSGDTLHDTVKAAVRDAIGQGYEAEAPGYLKNRQALWPKEDRSPAPTDGGSVEATTSPNASPEGPTGVDYPNRKLGFRYARSPESQEGFGNIALANMKPGETIRGYGEVTRITDKQIRIRGQGGKVSIFSTSSPKYTTLVRDVEDIVLGSQHGSDGGDVLAAIKRDPAFSYDENQIPQLSDTVRGGKDGPNNSILKPLVPPPPATETAPRAEASVANSPTPSFEDFRAALPKDGEGYPDIMGKGQEVIDGVRKGAKWADLSDAEKRAAYQAAGGNLAAIRAAIPAGLAREPRPARAKDATPSKETKTTPAKTARNSRQAQTLMDRANAAIERADEDLGQDRQTNTARRARMAGNSIAAATTAKRNAETALKIAQAQMDGTAGKLANVSSIADVERIETELRKGQYKRQREESTGYNPDRDREQVSEADIPFTEAPSVLVREGQGAELIEAAKGLRGLERGPLLRVRTMSNHAWARVTNTKEIEAMGKALAAVKKAKRGTYSTDMLATEVRDFKALSRIVGEDSKAVYAEYLALRSGTTVKVDPIAEIRTSLIGNKIPGFFETPQHLAERMVQAAGIKEGDKVLEPSAGMGRIANAAAEVAGKENITALEINSTLRDALEAQKYEVAASDFMEFDGGPYDAVVMNPPFEQRQDAEHVMRAYEMLKPGGRLVSIMGEGVFFGSDKKAVAFREWLESVDGISEQLPDGTFKESGTGVNTRLVEIAKAEEAPTQSKPDQENIPSETKDETAKPAPQSKAGQERIKDLGEKIGGARKDLASRGFQKAPKGKKDTRPGWMKRYQVSQIVADAFNKEKVGKWMITDIKKKYGGNTRLTFETEAEAEAAIPMLEVARNHVVRASTDGKFKVVRRVTDRKTAVIKDGFPSREEAQRYMAMNAVEIIETKTIVDDGIHPALEEAIREGEERRKGGRHVSGQDFMDVFGFRGVEFGNWNNNAERQHLLDQGFDALLDLAEITGLPPKAISLNGDLALAFGARGHGLSSSRAHYEANYGVINLTKIKGAGALAHEWMHAVDHFFARQDGKTPKTKTENKRGDSVFNVKDPREYFISHGNRYKSEVRAEVLEAIKGVMDAIYKRRAEFTEDVSSRERIEERTSKDLDQKLKMFRDEMSQEQRYGRKKAPATKAQMLKVDMLINKIKKGDLGEMTEAPSKAMFKPSFYKTVLDLAEVYKDVRGRQAYHNVQGRNVGHAHDIQNAIEAKARADQFLKDAKKQRVKERTVRSEFASEAWKMDQGRTSDYWSTNHEMLARGFEAYVYDRLKGIDARNDFLAYEKHNDLFEYKMFNVKPYPEGDERNVINDAFENLFDVIETRETDSGIEMYQVQPLEMFYSPLLKAIEGAKQGKAPAKDWKSIIAKLPGVKKAEIEWLGVGEWLDTQEGAQVTREDLADFVRSSQIEIVEDRLGERPDDFDARADVMRDDEIADGWDESDIEEQVLADAEADGEYTPGNFEGYTEDGGSNYREVLLRVPNLHKTGKNAPPAESELLTPEERKRWDYINDEIRNTKLWIADPDERAADNRRLDALRDEREAIREAMWERNPKVKNPARPFVQSGHFEQENVVVHARVKDRVGPNGEKVLFVEEIQSDLASKWRESSESPEVTARRRELEAERAAFNKEIDETSGAVWARLAEFQKETDNSVWVYAPNGNDYPLGVPTNATPGYLRSLLSNGYVLNVLKNEVVAQEYRDGDGMGQTSSEAFAIAVARDPTIMNLARRFNDAGKRADRVSNELLSLGTERSVDPSLPDTPFKEEHTYILMVKRLLRMAAEQGYDRLSWTPGYMQAERWNNAAQSVVEGGDWLTDAEGNRDLMLNMADNGNRFGVKVNSEGRIISATDHKAALEGQQLSKLIGPSLASDVLEQEKGNFSGQKITFPDSGYAIAYDQQVKRSVDNLAKGTGARAYVDKSLPDMGADVRTETMEDQRARAAEMSQSDLVDLGLSVGAISESNGEAWRTSPKRLHMALMRWQLDKMFPRESQVLQEGNPVWSIDITDDLRNKALEPMPVLRKGGEDVNVDKVAPLMSDLRARLDKMMLKRVNLGFDPDMVSQGKFTAGRLGNLQILIGASRDAVASLGHEALHALRAMNLFTKSEWAKLSEMAESEWMAKHNIEKRYPELSREAQIEEAIAEEMGKYLSKRHPNGKVRAIIAKVKRFFRALKEWMAGHSIAGPEDLFYDAAEGRIGARQGRVTNEANGALTMPISAQAPSLRTDTPEFKAWFGDSKVVDENGDPLVVYHGAKKAGFDRFDTDGKGKTAGTGAFFTESNLGAFTYSGTQREADIADVPSILADPEKYDFTVEKDGDDWIVTNPDGYDWVSQDKDQAITEAASDWVRGAMAAEPGNYAVYLSLQNPLIVDGGWQNWDSVGAEQEFFVQNEDGEVVEYFTNEADANAWAEDEDNIEEHGFLEVIEETNRLDAASTDDIARQAREDGYDGVIFENIIDEGPHGQGYGWDNKVYVAFSPTQIKSVNNRGTFDPSDPRILYQEQGSTSKEQRQPSRAARINISAQSAQDAAIPDRHIWEELADHNKGMLDRVRGASGALGDRWDAFRVKLQDRMLPLLRAEQAIERKFGKKISKKESAYFAEERYTGRVGRRFDQIDEGYTRPVISLISEADTPLALTDQNGDTRSDAAAASLYLMARHAKERNAHIASINPKMPDGGSGLTNAEADAIMQEARNGPNADRFRKIGNLMGRLGKEMIDLREASGLLSPQDAMMWRSMYKHYIPLQGFAETDMFDATLNEGRGSSLGGRRYNIKGPEGKRAMGRGSEAFDPLAAMITQAQEVAVRAEKNVVAQSLYNIVHNNPSKAMWEIVTPPTKRFFNSQTGLVEERVVGVGQEMLQPNEMALKIKGKERRIVFHDPRLAVAMGSVGTHGLSSALKPLSALSRYFSATNTMLSPPFVIVNAIRDMTTAQVNLKEFAGKDAGKIQKAALKNWIKARRGVSEGLKGNLNSEYAKWFREFEAAGGKVHFWNLENAEAQQSDIQNRIDLERGLGVKKFTKLNTRDNPALAWIERLNLSVDNAVRLASYVEARRQGWTKEDAASLSKNLTVNFNRRGEWGANMNALYPFANAAVQGSEVLLRAMKGKSVRRIVYSMIVFGILNDLLNAGMSEEDEDGELAYDKIPDYVSQRNLILRAHGGDTAGVVPLPYGYNAFFYTGQQIGKVIRGVKSPGDALGGILGATFGAFSPISGETISQTANPLIFDVINEFDDNRNWLGRPIRPENPYGDYGPQSYKAYNATEVSRAVSKGLNTVTGGSPYEPGLIDVSPEYIDHAVGLLGGGAGRFVMRAYGAGEKLATGQADQIEAHQIPLVRVLRYQSSDWLDQGRYFDFRNVVREAHDARKTSKEPGAPPLPAHIANTADLNSRLNQAEKKRKAINKKIDAVYADDSLSPRARNKKLEPLLKQRSEIYIDFNKLFIKKMGRQAE